MRILIYNETFWPSVGGAETIVRLMAQYLHKSGEDVVVVTQTPDKRQAPFPFSVIRQPSRQKLARLISNCDLVHIHSFHLELFLQAKLKGKKIVYTYHDLTPICPKGTKWKINGPCLHNAGPLICHTCLRESGSKKIWRRLMRPVAKSIISAFIDANVCVSQVGMQRFPIWRKQHIGNGIDTSFFKPSPTSKESGKPHVVFVGRLVPEKGCRVLIDALRLCVEQDLPFTLDIIGSGPQLSFLRSQLATHHLQDLVHFKGAMDGRALLTAINKADVVVIPSIWDEPFGLIAIEAFSCGLPVIAANVGALGQIVAEAGLTFRRGNAKELAEYLQYLLTNRSAREKLGQKARQVALQKYDYRMMAAAYHRLFQQLLNKMEVVTV